MAETVEDWLMQGDPAIRWQTMRDLLGFPPDAVEPERVRTATEGWGARLLALQRANGMWAGIYSPKWTSTTYTMLQLCEIGVQPDNAQAQAGARAVIDGLLAPASGEEFNLRLASLDDCVKGMILTICSVYGPHDERLHTLVRDIASSRIIDGAWNCRRARRQVQHSSVHTTINILEGLLAYRTFVPCADQRLMAELEASAHEFLLFHRLYQSHRTGAPMKPAFTMLSFPPRWHFDVLRGLDYLRACCAPRDERLSDAIALLNERRRPDGRWPLQNKHAGVTHFEMEPMGKASRWNTLRALRVLRWWERGDS